MPFCLRLGCGLVILGTGLAVIQPASAADWRLIRKPQSAAMPVPATEPGHVTYLRRLVRDANSAAERGDAVEAQRLAERAYQISVLYRAILAGRSDCAPEAMAALAQRYGSTVGLAEAKSSAAPASPLPEREDVAPAPAPDVLTMVDPKSREPSPPEPRSSSQADRKRTAARPASVSRKTTDQPLQPPPATSTGWVASSSAAKERPANEAEFLPPLVRREAATPLRSATESLPVIDRAVKSAPGREAKPAELDLDLDDKTSTSSPPAAAAAPIPPTENDAEAATVPAPETSRTEARPREDSPIQAGGAASDAVPRPPSSKPTVSTASQNIEIGSQLAKPRLRRSKPSLELSSSSERPAKLARPAIHVQEGSAGQWRDAGGKSVSATVVNKGFQLAEFSLPAGFGERLALVTGIAMLLGGLMLLGLSLRWN